VLLMLLTPALFAQEHYTEGPVWRIQLIRVKPTHMDDYLTSLRQSTKPLIEEQKKEGMIMDYKVFLKETKNSPEDWDILRGHSIQKPRSHGRAGGKRRNGSRQDSRGQTTGPTTCRETRRDPGDHHLGAVAGDLSKIARLGSSSGEASAGPCQKTRPCFSGRRSHFRKAKPSIACIRLALILSRSAGVNFLGLSSAAKAVSSAVAMFTSSS
jgi:hypothetical protein